MSVGTRVDPSRRSHLLEADRTLKLVLQDGAQIAVVGRSTSSVRKKMAHNKAIFIWFTK